LNILLAEDDRNFGLVLKNELEEDRVKVDLVQNGVEAILAFLSRNYDFVLLDLRMPRLSGIDALRIMRRMNPRIPVITISGNAGSQEMTESIECGALKCLRKPFEIASLKEEMWSYLGPNILR
jgi:DNA-binding response OmpR family regulator